MVKIGMVGIGDIAQKAYLPILGTRSDVELSIATRNREVLMQVGDQYHIEHRFSTLKDLLASGIDAAFIHSATAAHAEMVQACIQAGVHVFIDKPIAYHWQETERLVQMAKERKVGLLVGFNRRFAPMYRSMREALPSPEIVLMQKHRTSPVSSIRSTIMDDFIHVVDTLISFVGEPTSYHVHGKIEQGKVHYLVLHLQGAKSAAIGMMNRHTGVTEERLELMREGQKQVVHNLTYKTLFEQGTEIHQTAGDWTPMLERRGFVNMIEHVLNQFSSEGPYAANLDETLCTHRLCEEIINELESKYVD